MGIRHATCTAVLILVSLSAGCGRRPPRIEAPDWNPQKLAEDTVKLLDKNGDGVIDTQELEGFPGLKFAAARIDANEDSTLDLEELRARFQLYEEMRTGLRSQSFRFTYRGRPLANATVRMVPEEFVKDVIEPASGTTSQNGIVMPCTEVENVPAVRVGFYRIEVTSEDTAIPQKYNTHTELGIEVSPVSEGYGSAGMMEFNLR